jgi:very-short-patch-repair endonuclease
MSAKAFGLVMATYGLPEPEYEHRFHPHRKWRIDIAWPSVKLAIEIEGGVWTGGRHTRGAGFLADMDKYNALASMGWTLLRTTPTDLGTTKFIDFTTETYNHIIQRTAL